MKNKIEVTEGQKYGKLTTEQKAKFYDEAIEKLRSLHDDYDTVSTLIDIKEELENIFPELKESEDEKIRKALLEMVHYTPDVECEKIYKINKEECIAWLEKQGEQNNSNVKDYNSIDPHFGKPTDKIEPNFNFNVGQWIIATGKCVYLITKIDGFNVTLVDVDGNEYVFDTSSLEDAHLWTIQDAKDGDVLCSHHSEVDYPWIGIFHKLNTDNTFDSHCYLPAGEHGKFCPPSKKDIFGRKYVKNHLSTYMVPATKEQRDLLFQKMKEAGYEWDAEKKELKKIENEIEIPFGAKDSELQEATYYYYIPKGFHAEIDNDKVVIKNGEKHTAWSEEDERNMQNIDSVLFYDRKLPEETCVKLRDFLKTLKDRVGCEANCTTTKEWSEEDERMYRGLHNLIYSTPCCDSRKEFSDWLNSIRPRIIGLK